MRDNSLVHKNNFDFLRLLFAIFVVIGHSYAISGVADMDWIAQLTNHQAAIAQVGLLGFFSISGYLVYYSMVRSKNIAEYYWKRILRIFPGLFMVLLLTTIFGIFLYNSDMYHYIRNKSAWTYLLRNLTLIKPQRTITGIFEDNPKAQVINGSLWTIPYEFLMYILLSCLFLFKNRGRVILVASALMILILRRALINVIPVHFIPFFSITRVFPLAFCFAVGSILAACNFKELNKRYQVMLIPICLCILIVAYNLGYYRIFQSIVFPVAVISFGNQNTLFISNLSTRIGDLSYGVYLYGFPIEQTLEHFFKLSQFPLMIWGVLLSLLCAFFSWNIVEKRALALK